MAHRTLTISAVLCAVLIGGPALSQFSGPGSRQEGPAHKLLRTVSEVLQDAVDDQPVQLTGLIVEQTGRETFVFRDHTGEIVAEIDEDDFPAGQPITPTTRVVIHGEVDKRFMRKPEIDADRVVVAAEPAPAGTLR